MENRIETLNTLGCNPRLEEGRILTLILPLSSIQWCSLCMKDADLIYESLESSYVGGCCASMSAIQDLLTSVFRFGGEIDGPDLLELGEEMEYHGDELFKELPFIELEKKVQKGFSETTDPWEIISLIYLIAKPLLSSHPIIKPTENPIMDAFSTLSWMGQNFTFSDLFQRNEKDKTSFNANQIIRMFRTLPALKLLQEHACSILDTTEWEGYALCWKQVQGPWEERIAKNRMGYSFHLTKKEAQAVLDSDSELNQELEIKKVFLSVSEGVKLND